MALCCPYLDNYGKWKKAKRPTRSIPALASEEYAETPTAACDL